MLFNLRPQDKTSIYTALLGANNYIQITFFVHMYYIVAPSSSLNLFLLFIGKEHEEIDLQSVINVCGLKQMNLYQQLLIQWKVQGITMQKT